MGKQEEQPREGRSASRFFSTFSRRRRDDRTSHIPGPRVPSRFQVKQELGRGGMGAVYLAYDRRSGHDVALKILHGFGAADRLRLKDEFRSLSGIVHPNLIDLYELFIDEHTCMFTMEYLCGVDLATRGRQIVKTCKERGERGERLRALALQLALALHAVHEGGKLHRDIKPSNVLVTHSDRVVLLDFGLAASLSSRAGGSGGKNAVEGTLLYMSPEQLWGQATTRASDWYSYGITLREALTGAPPSRVDLLAKVERKRLRESGFDVPEDLDELICGLLQGDASRRPGAEEIVQCLGGTLGLQSRGSSIPPLPASTAFVGREALLDSLFRLSRQAADGERVVVRLSGPSGIGKSSLMLRFLESLQEQPDVLALRSRCHPKEALAFNALDGFVDELSRELKESALKLGELELPQLQALAQVFPVLAQAAELEPPGSPLQISDRDKRQFATDAIGEILKRISTTRKVVLWLDDVQWGDADSGRLLRNLLRAPDCPPMLLVLSYREGDEKASACLNELMEDADLWNAIVHMRVEPLDDEHAAALLNSVASEHWQGDAESRAQLLRMAAGSPFFLTEFARYLNEQSANGDRTLPANGLGLDELLRFRMRGLSPEARTVVEVLAVAGAPLERETILSAARLDLAQRGLMTNLEKLSIVRTVDLDRNRIEFYHDKLREEVMRTLPDDLCAAHHGAIAQALLSTATPNPLAALEHFEAAGDVDEVRRYIVTAANSALKLLAFERAARLYQRAIELDSTELPRHELYRRLGSSLGSAGRGKEAAAAFSKAAKVLGSQSGESTEEWMHLQQAAAEQFIQTGHFQQGTEMIRQVLTELDVPFPKSRGQALRKALVLRLSSLVLGVRPSKRKRPPTAIELRRFDALWSADTRLAMVDYALCNYATIRCVHDALKLGDPSRMSRALALEAAFCATLPQTVFQQRAEALHRKACELARDPLATPYDATFCKAMRAVIALYSCRFHETCQMADESIAELPPGRGWELGPWVMWSLIGLTWSGQITELLKRVRALREQAAVLDDQQLEQNISLGPPAIAWLILDQPEETLRRADAALSWAPSNYTAQHYEHYVTTVDCDLYERRGLSAWRRTVETWPSHKREFFLALTFIRDDLLRTRARAALAAAIELERSGRGRTEFDETREDLLDAVRSAAREMRQHRLDAADGFAALAEAGLHNVTGDVNKARSCLREASENFDRADMQLLHHVAKFWLERLDHIQSCDAEAWLLAEGVVQPERLCDALAPGFRRVVEES